MANEPKKNAIETKMHTHIQTRAITDFMFARVCVCVRACVHVHFGKACLVKLLFKLCSIEYGMEALYHDDRAH